MLLGSVQIAGEELGTLEIKDICESLKNNSIRLLSLRGCHMDDLNFQRLTESLKGNDSLAQLNLNLGVVNSKERIKWLTQGLIENDSLTSLFLHGTPLQDDGMAILQTALEGHPKLQSLDLGDCQLGDEGLSHICSLLASEEHKADIVELTLTGNQGISQAGWTQLAMAIGNHSSLKSLFLDYTNIGDFGAGTFAVALAASKTIQVLDLEGCGITDTGAEFLYDLITIYETPLKELNLAENKVTEDLLEDIKDVLNEDKGRTRDSLPKRRSSPQGKATSPE
eukprot:Seg1768.6 transcript_id=Seg1768.6/GoldUCD/mRNA.D3Y31 product="Leucine-rich repeat-containing protein 73" protein_id=Seg1768.6/GoldUCD/D3Y31